MNINQIAEMYGLKIIPALKPGKLKVLRKVSGTIPYPVEMNEKEVVAFLKGVEFGGNEMGVFVSRK